MGTLVCCRPRGMHRWTEEYQTRHGMYVRSILEMVSLIFCQISRSHDLPASWRWKSRGQSLHTTQQLIRVLHTHRHTNTVFYTINHAHDCDVPIITIMHCDLFVKWTNASCGRPSSLSGPCQEKRGPSSCPSLLDGGLTGSR